MSATSQALRVHESFLLDSTYGVSDFAGYTFERDAEPLVCEHEDDVARCLVTSISDRRRTSIYLNRARSVPAIGVSAIQLLEAKAARSDFDGSDVSGAGLVGENRFTVIRWVRVGSGISAVVCAFLLMAAAFFVGHFEGEEFFVYLPSLAVVLLTLVTIMLVSIRVAFRMHLILAGPTTVRR